MLVEIVRRFMGVISSSQYDTFNRGQNCPSVTDLRRPSVTGQYVVLIRISCVCDLICLVHLKTDYCCTRINMFWEGCSTGTALYDMMSNVCPNCCPFLSFRYREMSTPIARHWIYYSYWKCFYKQGPRVGNLYGWFLAYAQYSRLI